MKNRKAKKHLYVFCFLLCVCLLLPLAACGKPSEPTVYPFADVDFVDGGVGVFDEIPLRSLTAAEFDRVVAFLKELALRDASGVEDSYGGDFPCVQLRDASGAEYRIYCDDLCSDGVWLLYCTRFAESGTETRKYYIDEADMRAFIAMCREVLDQA